MLVLRSFCHCVSTETLQQPRSCWCYVSYTWRHQTFLRQLRKHRWVSYAWTAVLIVPSIKHVNGDKPPLDHSTKIHRMGRSRKAGRATRKRRRKQNTRMLTHFAAVLIVSLLASDVPCLKIQLLYATSRGMWGWWSFFTEGASPPGCCSQPTSQVQHR